MKILAVLVCRSFVLLAAAALVTSLAPPFAASALAEIISIEQLTPWTTRYLVRGSSSMLQHPGTLAFANGNRLGYGKPCRRYCRSCSLKHTRSTGHGLRWTATADEPSWAANVDDVRTAWRQALSVSRTVPTLRSSPRWLFQLTSRHFVRDVFNLIHETPFPYMRLSRKHPPTAYKPCRPLTSLTGSAAEARGRLPAEPI